MVTVFVPDFKTTFMVALLCVCGLKDFKSASGGQTGALTLEDRFVSIKAWSRIAMEMSARFVANMPALRIKGIAISHRSRLRAVCSMAIASRF